MRSASFFGVVITALAFLFVFHAEAAEKGKVSITLASPALVGGKVLPAGDYVVRWKSDNPGAEATFYSQGRDVADVSCKIVDRNSKSPYDEVETHLGKDGRTVVREIRIEGKTSVLVFS